MGCDIHSHAERRTVTGTWKKIPRVKPFDWRSYRLYGFLAGVRNYSESPVIAAPRGFPADASAKVARDYRSWEGDAHSASWLSLAELLEYDYDQVMEDRRCMRQVGPQSFNGGSTCEPGEGEKLTVREFLGTDFFDELEKLKKVGAERVVFWFDN